MTFTIAARCPRTGHAGVALTTVSLAAGGLIPFYTPAGDIVISQAFVCARDGLRIMHAMIAGTSAAYALEAVMNRDPHIGYRQILVLARSGETLAYTGEHCRPWAGHCVDGDLIVAGNVLAGAHVLDAMVAVYRAAIAEPLGERLLRALEAGRDAGGQALANGMAISERSAMVRVLGAGDEASFPLLDLRVDLHPSAVHELRRLDTIHAVYAAYSARRDADAPNAPSIVAYEAEQVRQAGPFAERPSCYR